ncbi:hypothetical protein BMS3Abin16_00335 [archaeon BMS3Abin16]|nr:hypothetical protein BMS3Abin16_00335 [archaeon BMS3Abin16]
MSDIVKLVVVMVVALVIVRSIQVLMYRMIRKIILKTSSAFSTPYAGCYLWLINYKGCENR